jgi:flagellar protein FlaG
MKLPSIANAPPSVDSTPAPPAAPAAVSESRPPPEAAGAAVDPKALQQLADKLTQTIGMTGQQVQFSVDNDTGKTVLRVTDAESGAVLRQIPGDEALSMARILDRMQGVLIRQKA